VAVPDRKQAVVATSLDRQTARPSGTSKARLCRAFFLVNDLRDYEVGTKGGHGFMADNPSEKGHERLLDVKATRNS
jgi:hypothetical protein